MCIFTEICKINLSGTTQSSPLIKTLNYQKVQIRIEILTHQP